MQEYTIEELKGGRLPADLGEAESLVVSIVSQAREAVPATAMLLAAARRWFRSIGAWVDWARRVSGLEGDDLHHRRQIGDLLLDLRDDRRVFDALFGLDQQKLLALYRLPRREVAAFLSRWDVQSLARDEVRARVSEWLGEDDGKARRQPLLPGFDKLVGHLGDDAAEVGEFIANAVRDGDQARRAALASERLRDASVVYYAALGDVRGLQSIREGLVSKAREIGEVIEGLG